MEKTARFIAVSLNLSSLQLSGAINGFKVISFTPIYCVRPEIWKVQTLNVNIRFLVYWPNRETRTVVEFGRHYQAED